MVRRRTVIGEPFAGFLGVLMSEQLADLSSASVDQSSTEWRMAYAVWTDHFRATDELRRKQADRRAPRNATELRRQTLRFAGLALTLTATAVLTTVVMFWALAATLG